MKTLLALIAVLAVFASCVCAQINGTDSPVDPTDETTVNEATTVTTTTPKPPQSTEPPSPETSSTPPVETTTEVAVVTSEAPSPTPTSAPSGKIANGTWFVNDTDTNIVCVVLKIGVRFNLTYTDKNNKTKFYVVDLPVNGTNKATSTGDCGNNGTSQQITLDFYNNFQFRLDFEQNNEKKKFYVKTFMLDYDQGKAPFPTEDVKDPKKVTSARDNQTEWEASVGNSYLCISDTTINLSDGNGKDVLTVAELQVEAFRNDKDLEFGDAQECSADDNTNNIVPIAVGAALAALVVIVLIAYLISRNKNKGGYESV